jgi:hypothetical protein
VSTLGTCMRSFSLRANAMVPYNMFANRASQHGPEAKLSGKGVKFVAAFIRFTSGIAYELCLQLPEGAVP